MNMHRSSRLTPDLSYEYSLITVILTLTDHVHDRALELLGRQRELHCFRTEQVCPAQLLLLQRQPILIKTRQTMNMRRHIWACLSLKVVFYTISWAFTVSANADAKYRRSRREQLRWCRCMYLNNNNKVVKPYTSFAKSRSNKKWPTVVARLMLIACLVAESIRRWLFCLCRPTVALHQAQGQAQGNSLNIFRDIAS